MQSVFDIGSVRLPGKRNDLDPAMGICVAVGASLVFYVLAAMLIGWIF